MDNNQHLRRTCYCKQCSWAGVTGDLIAPANRPNLRCPKCDSAEIGYVVAEPPAMAQ